MIICRTPYRISFFGGGTDYPAWYRENRGAVLSTSINKYSYITCRYLPPFFDYRFRIRYYQREETNCISEIRHPSVRECLQFMEIDKGVDLVHHGDLPARSGLGSSSTFTVGLLHALHALKHRMPTKRDLALQAMRIEQEIIKECVGSQDQTAAAFGGLNQIEFGGSNEIVVKPIIMEPGKLERLQQSTMLFFTGFVRSASEVVQEQVQNIQDRRAELTEMHALVDEAVNLLLQPGDELREFGNLLDRQWKIKRRLGSRVSNSKIDAIYETGIRAGAHGGKLLGAGNGGFILFLVEPERKERIRRSLEPLLHVPCRFEFLGSQIVYYSPDDYF
jgi:D-glycero-alpha-D-manno-heptose-7-phosphate kinase